MTRTSLRLVFLLVPLDRNIEVQRGDSQNPLDSTTTYGLRPAITYTDDIHVRNLFSYQSRVEIKANSPAYGQLRTQLLRHEHTDRRGHHAERPQMAETVLPPDSPAMCVLFGGRIAG